MARLSERCSTLWILNAGPALKQPARAAKTRHHRADWNPGDRRDLSVRQIFDVAEHHHLSVLRRKPADEPIKPHPLLTRDEQGLWIPR